MTPTVAGPRRRWVLATLAVLGLLGMLLALPLPPGPPASANPPYPVVVDGSQVTLVDELATVAPGPTVVLPLRNTTGSDVYIGAVAVDPASPEELATGPLATALVDAGIADPTSVTEATQLSMPEPCSGVTIVPETGDPDRCMVVLRNEDTASRPSGTWLRFYDTDDTSGSVVFETFVLWPEGTTQAVGDLFTDAQRLPTSSGRWPDLVEPGVPATLDVTASTIGLGSEGDPTVTGSAAVRSWWLALPLNVPGRLAVDVRAVDGLGNPSAVGIRAQLFRLRPDPHAVPAVTGLEPLGVLASTSSPGGTLRLETPVGTAATYYLAVDDLGTATSFRVDLTLDARPTGLRPDDGAVLDLPDSGDAVGTVTAYNGDATPTRVLLPALSTFTWGMPEAAYGACRTFDEADQPLDAWAFPTAGPLSVEVDGESACTMVAAAVAGVSPGTTEPVALAAPGPTSPTYTFRVDRSGVIPEPGNDDFDAAQDLSSLAIPAYVAGVGGQPEKVVSTVGTTVGATREPFEYGTAVANDSTETPPPNGTVWFRYTAPTSGFSGRLGYRISPGFFVDALGVRDGQTVPPTPRYDVLQPARGNTWPPSSLAFVRMEPGHTVWFQVQASIDGSNQWSDGEFSLELYQAPNEQDDIAQAYDVNGADNPDGSGRPWSDPFAWSGDGDTYHLTVDQPGGSPTMWFTATFDRAGQWNFTATSESASGSPSTRPLGVRLYRAPGAQRITDPGVLTPVAASQGSERNGYLGYPGAIWVTQLTDVAVQPGRYYWSVDQGAGGPTFFGLSASFRGGGVIDTDPPTITITGIDEGATVDVAGPTVTITSDEPLALTDCTLDITRDDTGSGSSNPIGCLTPGSTGGDLTLPSLPDGSVTLTVFGRDAAGNGTTVTRSFSVQVPPEVTITSPADGATYAPGAVPPLAWTCTDNNGAVASETPSLGPAGDPWPGAPPSTEGTWRINVDCIDVPGNGSTTSVTYTVRPSTILEIRTIDMDGQPVVGTCYSIDGPFIGDLRVELQRSCDAASGNDADGAADGVTRIVDASVGQASYVLRNSGLPPLRYPVPNRTLEQVPVGQTTDLTVFTYRCASTCLWVQPRTGDGAEPTFPLWPLGVPGDLVAPVPMVPQDATAPPPFPTAFVIPDLTPGVTTDIPVVADDFGRAPLEVGRIRFTPAAGLNRLDPLTILPAHTITANLQNPDGSAASQGGYCLQLRGVSPTRAPVAQCADAGVAELRWRALPGFYVVEQQSGTFPPDGLLAPVLPANVPDTQTIRSISVGFRFGEAGTVRVTPVNFQLTPIRSLPAAPAPACEIGLFLVTGSTIATSPTATACFPAGSPPGQAVFRVPPGEYVVTRTAAFDLPPLTTGANVVTVTAGSDVTTDLSLFVGAGDVPTAVDDTAVARPGAATTVAVLSNDSDPTGERLTTSIVTPPGSGSASVTLDGRIVYVASQTATGTDTVRYAAVDRWGNRSEATLTLTIDPWAVLEVGLVTEPRPPLSRNVTFDVVVDVRNSSGREAASPTVSVTFPAGVVYEGGASPSTCAGVAPGSSGTITCPLKSLPAAARATVRLPARVVSRPASEQVTITGVVSTADCADNDGGQPGNQCDTTATTVAVPKTEVGVTVSSDVSSIAVGGAFRYVVDVTNSGPTRAEVTVPVDLPPEAGLVGVATQPPLSSCAFAPALSAGAAGTPDVTSTCRLTVAGGTTARLVLDARALRVPVGGVLAASATTESVDCTSDAPPGVAGSCGPPASGGPTVTAARVVATVEQTLPAGGANVRVGDTVRVRGGVRNDGPTAARTPQVQIQLPPELGATALVAQPAGSACSFSPPLPGGVATPALRLNCSLPTLPPGGAASFELEARVVEVPIAPAAPVTVRVASIDCADTSPATAGVQCDTVAAGPGVVRTTLAPTVTMTPSSPSVGDTVEVRFSMQNTGGVPARSLQTRLVLPAELAAVGLTEITGLTSCRYDPPLQPGLTGTPSVTTSCTHPDLGPGSTNVVQMRAIVRSLPAGGTFAVRGEVGSTDCRDLVVGDTVRTCATAYLPTPTTTSSAGIGPLSLRASTGTISALQPISSSLLPSSPSGVAFPYGAMSFTVTDVPVGGSTEILVGLADQVAGYWKLSSTGWAQYPTVHRVGTGLLFTLTDGGYGDADGLANGIIVDPGAVGVPNQDPTVQDRSVTTPQGTPITVDVLTGATDPDGGVLEVTGATGGELGSVTVTPWNVTYTPYPEASGSDSFLVTVADGQGGTSAATVSVSIGGTQASGGIPTPVAVDDGYVVSTGASLTIPAAEGLLVNDQGVSTSAVLVSPPTSGVLDLAADGSFTYEAPAATGPVTFTYRAVSEYGSSAEASVTIDVSAAPPPTTVPPTTVPPTTLPTLSPPTTSPAAPVAPISPPTGQPLPPSTPVSDDLPATGTNPFGTVGGAAFLIAIGVALWAVSRRRSRPQEDPT